MLTYYWGWEERERERLGREGLSKFVYFSFSCAVIDSVFNSLLMMSLIRHNKSETKRERRGKDKERGNIELLIGHDIDYQSQNNSAEFLHKSQNSS